MNRAPRSVTYYCPQCGRTKKEYDIPPTTCKDCSQPFDVSTLRIGGRRVKFEVDQNLLFVIPKVKDLGTGKDRVYGAWMPEVVDEELSIYFSCALCGTINDLSDLRISPIGIAGCFHCGECYCDTYVRFGDWGPYKDMRRKQIDGNVVFRYGMVRYM